MLNIRPGCQEAEMTGSGRNRTWWYLSGALVFVIALGGLGVWYFVFRDDAPAAVDIDHATESLQAQEPTVNERATGVTGTWTIDHTIGDFADFTSSFAGYRVREEVVSIGAKTAVGRTPGVSGSFTIAGKTISEAEFTVDMTTLQSDHGGRDDAMRDEAIETKRFPTATFSLTDAMEFDAIPVDGTRISVEATGDLTLHGVTREVTIPLDAERTGNVIAVTGQIDIPFANYDIDEPTAAGVLSVEDHGILEVQLFLTKTA
jgi:polyisoprenoid-binding protein YceI